METPKIIPMGDRVLVKIAPIELVTKSGIIIPDTAAKDRPIQGVVEAVAPARFDDKLGVLVPSIFKVGDVVLFSKYGPDEVNMGEDKYYILKEENILAVIK